MGKDGAKDSVFLAMIAEHFGDGKRRERLLQMSRHAFVREMRDAGKGFCEGCDQYFPHEKLVATADDVYLFHQCR